MVSASVLQLSEVCAGFDPRAVDMNAKGKKLIGRKLPDLKKIDPAVYKHRLYVINMRKKFEAQKLDEHLWRCETYFTEIREDLRIKISFKKIIRNFFNEFLP